MKLYPTLNVSLTYQNFGDDTYLGILRGTTEQIYQAFNGLYNLCATNGEILWNDHTKTVGLFWTSKRALRKFFLNQWLTKHLPVRGNTGVIGCYTCQKTFHNMAGVEFRKGEPVCPTCENSLDTLYRGVKGGKKYQLTSPDDKIAWQYLKGGLKFYQARQQELRQSHETFRDFGDVYMPEEHGVGKVRAERPDSDFKDSVLTHAFRDRTGEKV